MVMVHQVLETRALAGEMLSASPPTAFDFLNETAGSPFPGQLDGESLGHKSKLKLKVGPPEL